MKRNLNYTDRLTIELGDVSVVLNNNEEYPCVDMSVKLDVYDLDESLNVYLEATGLGFYQKFDFGTVGDIVTPKDNKLTEFPKALSETASFYLKVVDESNEIGLLMALSRKIIPEVMNPDGTTARKSFLDIVMDDLGSVPWVLDTGGDKAAIKLNSKFQDIRFLKSNEYFKNLILPSVVRELVTRIAFIEEDFSDDGDSWCSPWNRFAIEKLGIDLPSDEATDSDKWDYVDQYVKGFCDGLEAADRLSEKLIRG